MGTPRADGRIIGVAIALLAVVCIQRVRAGETILTPTKAGSHDVQMKDLGGGEWEVRTTGTDPYFFVKTHGGAAIDLGKQPIFSFEYDCPRGVGRLLVYVGSVLNGSHLVMAGDMPHRNGWANAVVDVTATRKPVVGPLTSLRVTLGERADNVVRVRGFAARARTAGEIQAMEAHARQVNADRRRCARILAYLKKSFSDRLTQVSADARQIRIEGRLGEKPDGLELAEVPMWEDVTALKTPATLLPIGADAQGRFTAAVDRTAPDGRDRLLSAWAIVRKAGELYEPVSAMRYVTKETARANLPAAKPRSIKGLGGCPFSNPDIKALNISSVTLNIVLNNLFDAAPGPGRTPYVYGQKTWYVRDGVIAGYDRSMEAAAERGLMVSAIILLRPVGNSPPDSWIAMAADPQADSAGLYVMPNFFSQAGAQAYAAAMNFLAERYTRPDGKFGRIHDWIMHNEINNGWYWTNAGDKTMTTYLDAYQKSMRTGYLLARQYDPHAKPLISLDHSWTDLGDARSYAGRDLLETLVKFSQKEGDFEWGIAFHPYAVNLFNPRTWEDPDCTFDFNTRYITFKNIEVLDAWARQPRVAYDGTEPREIQLTEQGLNSRDYSPKALAEQAAGLAYAWTKIEPLKTITAFQYHLWADNRGEGGLRLGLRKFSDDPKDPLGKKPSWDLYQAIGTDRWEQASAFARRMIGIKDWSDVRYTGAIR